MHAGQQIKSREAIPNQLTDVGPWLAAMGIKLGNQKLRQVKPHKLINFRMHRESMWVGVAGEEGAGQVIKFVTF